MRSNNNDHCQNAMRHTTTHVLTCMHQLNPLYETMLSTPCDLRITDHSFLRPGKTHLQRNTRTKRKKITMVDQRSIRYVHSLGALRTSRTTRMGEEPRITHRCCLSA